MPDVTPAGARRYDAWAYVIIGLIAIPLVALGIGALILPPGVSFTLIRRGVAEGRMSWVIFGGLTGVIWLLLLYATGRKLMRPAPRAEAE